MGPPHGRGSDASHHSRFTALPMSRRILVVEDEDALCTLLEYNLEAGGFTPVIVRDGDEALLRLAEEDFDLAILDWMLPGLSGLEICRRIRARPETRSLPVIMLTARGEEEDRVRGLDTGADDYVTKPFSVSELLARIRAILRRGGADDDALRAGDIALVPETKRVHRGTREIRLGPTEFRLLETLMKRPGRVYSREQLLDLVWGRDVYVEARTVDVHVGRLRKALNRPGEPDPLRTVRASGYAFDETYG